MLLRTKLIHERNNRSDRFGPCFVDDFQKADDDHEDRSHPVPIDSAEVRSRESFHCSSLSTRRKVRGYVLAVLLPPLLTMALTPFRGELNLVSDMLLFLLMTVVVALVGGLAPALIAAVAGSLLLNYYFTPPLHTLTISETNNSLALIVFVVVAALVSAPSTSRHDAPDRRRERPPRHAPWPTSPAVCWAAKRRSHDAASRPGNVRPTAVTLLERTDDGWTPVASAGPAVYSARVTPTPRCLPGTAVLALRGGLLHAEDQRLIGAFASQAAVVLDRIRLSRAAAEAAPLAEANKVRTALLAAVGHDFRTPLAAAKASVSTLLSFDLDLPRTTAASCSRPPTPRWTGWPRSSTTSST